jgi:hypothetical protein
MKTPNGPHDPNEPSPILSTLRTSPLRPQNGRWGSVRERPRLVSLGWTGLALRSR